MRKQLIKLAVNIPSIIWVFTRWFSIGWIENRIEPALEYFSRRTGIQMPYLEGVLIGAIFVGSIWWLVNGQKMSNGKKGISALPVDDKEYIAKLNKALQDISSYYENLVGTVNIRKIRPKKIRDVDKMIFSRMGLKYPIISKPPKLSELLKAVVFIYYDILRISYVYYIRVRLSHRYLIELFLDIGSIPDKVGIGLSSYANNRGKYNESLQRLMGERVASNETVTAILRCRDACYAINNIYLWLLMHQKEYKKRRFDASELIEKVYGYRGKMVAYAFSDVNKAVIKDFLGE